MQLKKGSLVYLGVALVLVATSAGTGAAADAVNGRRIAERWCAECHVVTLQQRHASDAVPTFAEIGGSARYDEASLAAFLATPHHSRMPNLSLSRSEIADLVAYIKGRVR